jgi:hypothetical protein
MSNFLESAIHTAVKQEIERVTNDAIKKAQAEISNRVPEIVAAISLQVASRYSMENLGHELLIHVKLEATE